MRGGQIWTNASREDETSSKQNAIVSAGAMTVRSSSILRSFVLIRPLKTFFKVLIVFASLI
jgi:hypothetical protein